MQIHLALSTNPQFQPDLKTYNQRETNSFLLKISEKELMGPD